MSKSIKNSNAPLDTLVFPRKGQCSQAIQVGNIPNLAKRARSKVYTHKIIRPLLIDETRKLHKQYKRAFFCSETIVQDGQTFKSHYCNSRLCNTCNRIRTAKMMNGYMPQVQALVDAQFVTLTVPSVNARLLRNRVIEMKSDMRKIKDVMRKRGQLINGILKYEANYNPDTKTFNPHIHLVVDGKDKANQLVDLWVGMLNNKKCSRKAQDIRACDEKSLHEVFKYTSKVFIKTAREKDGNKRVLNVHIEALNTIMEAFSGMKTITPLGNIHRVTEDIEENDLQTIPVEIEPDKEPENWVWYKNDWVNASGEILSGFKGVSIKFNYPNFFANKVGKFFQNLPAHPFEQSPINPERVKSDMDDDGRIDRIIRGKGSSFYEDKKHQFLGLKYEINNLSAKAVA